MIYDVEDEPGNFTTLQEYIDLHSQDGAIEEARQELCDAIIEKTRLGHETERFKKAKAAYLQSMGYEA